MNKTRCTVVVPNLGLSQKSVGEVTLDMTWKCLIEVEISGYQRQVDLLPHPLSLGERERLAMTC